MLLSINILKKYCSPYYSTLLSQDGEAGNERQGRNQKLISSLSVPEKAVKILPQFSRMWHATRTREDQRENCSRTDLDRFPMETGVWYQRDSCSVSRSFPTTEANDSSCRKEAVHRDHCQRSTLTLTRRWHFREPLQEPLQGLDISIDSSSLLIAQGNFLKHLEQTIPRLKPKPPVPLFGNIEITASAGHAMWALIEKFIAAPAVSQIAVPPAPTTNSGSTR